MFKATHTITITRNGSTETIPVHVDDGRCYSREEWESESTADWELVDGELRFQGQTPVCDECSYERICRARTVVTYQLAYVPGHKIELCDECARAWSGATLGQVLHGRHSGYCGRP